MTDGQTVLIVEDDPDILDLCKFILKTEKCRLDVADSASKALVALRARPYDVVVTDHVVLPGSAMPFHAEVKKHWPRTEVIVMTGRASLEDALDAFRAGARDYLPKPFGGEAMRAALRRCRKRGPSGELRLARLMNTSAWNGELASFSDFLQEILRTVKRELDTEQCCMLLLERGGGGVHFGKFMDGGITHERLHQPAGEGVYGAVARSGRPLLLNDVEGHPILHSETDIFTNRVTRRIIAFPMRGRGGLLGVVAAVDKTSGEPFSDEDLMRLGFFVDQIVEAMEAAGIAAVKKPEAPDGGGSLTFS